jgi:hypothetical protein
MGPAQPLQTGLEYFPSTTKKIPITRPKEELCGYMFISFKLQFKMIEMNFKQNNCRYALIRISNSWEVSKFIL